MSSTDGTSDARFAEIANSPEPWFRLAEQLFEAGKVLVERLLGGPRPPLDEKQHSQRVGYLRSSGLLFALALENAFKGAKVSKRPFKIRNGALDKRSIGGGRTGHDLTILANEAGVELSGPERDLLKRLTTFAGWGGRYPGPISESQFLKALEDREHRLLWPADLQLVERLLAAAQGVANGARID